MKTLEIDGVKIAEISDEPAEFLKRIAAKSSGFVSGSETYAMPHLVDGNIAYMLMIEFPDYVAP